MREGGVSGLQDLGSRRRSNVNKMLEKRKKAIHSSPTAKNDKEWMDGKGLRDEDKKAQIAGINTWQAMNEADDMEGAADEGYKRDFLAWLMGKGKEEDHRRTPWYRDDWMLRHLDDVRNWVETFVDVIYETELAMIKLALNGPTNLQEAEIYYKYLVNLDWMRRDDKFFFVDMVGLINGGSLGGGLTEDELNILNLKTHLRHGPWKGVADRQLWHDQTASQEDVFQVSQARRDEAQRLLGDKRETLLQKIDAIHRNALEPMQDTGNADIPNNALTLNYQADQHLTPDQIEAREREQQLLEQDGGAAAVEAGRILQEASMLGPMSDYLMRDEVLLDVDDSFFVKDRRFGIMGVDLTKRKEQMAAFLNKAQEVSSLSDVELGHLIQLQRSARGGMTGPIIDSYRQFMQYKGRDFDQQLQRLLPVLRGADDPDDAEMAVNNINALSAQLDVLERVQPVNELVKYLQSPGRVRDFLRSVTEVHTVFHPNYEGMEEAAEILKFTHPELIGMFLTASIISAYKRQGKLAVEEADRAYDSMMGAVARGEITNPYLSQALNDPKRYETIKSVNRLKASMKFLQPLWQHQFESMDARVFAHIQISKVWSELVTASYKQQDLDLIRDNLGIDMREVRQHSDLLRIQAMMGKYMGDDATTRSMVDQFDTFQDRMWAQRMARAAPGLLFLDNAPGQYYSLEYNLGDEVFHWNDVSDAIMDWGATGDTRMRNWQRALYWHALEATNKRQWATNMGGVEMFHSAWQALSTVWGVGKWGMRMIGGAIYIGGRILVDIAKGNVSGRHTIALAYYALAAGSVILGGTPVGPELARWMNLLNTAYLAYNAYSFFKSAKTAMEQGKYFTAGTDGAIMAVLAGYASPSIPQGTPADEISRLAGVQRWNAFTSSVIGTGSDWINMLSGQRVSTTATGFVSEMTGNVVRNFVKNTPNQGVASGADSILKAWEQISDAVVSGASSVTGYDFKSWTTSVWDAITLKSLKEKTDKHKDEVAKYNRMYEEQLRTAVEDMIPRLKQDTKIEDDATLRQMAKDALQGGVAAAMSGQAVYDAFAIKFAESRDDATRWYTDRLNLDAILLKNALEGGADGNEIAAIMQGMASKFTKIGEMQLDHFKKPAFETPMIQQAIDDEGWFSKSHPIIKTYISEYLRDEDTQVELNGALFGSTKVSTRDVREAFDLYNKNPDAGAWGTSYMSRLLQQMREDPGFKQQMYETLQRKAEQSYEAIRPMIAEESKRMVSEQIKQQSLQEFTVAQVLSAVESYPDGEEKTKIKELLEDFYTATRIKLVGSVRAALGANATRTNVEEHLEALGERPEEPQQTEQQDETKPTAGFAEYAMAAGGQAAAFDLLNGKQSLAYDLWTGGTQSKRFQDYAKDWRAKDQTLFDNEFQEARRREMAWRDDSFNRANAGAVQSLLELSQNPNAMERAALMAKLFGLNKDYKFLRTNLIARMGFTGFSGIHMFLGRGKRTIKQPWKKNKPARTLEEPKKPKKSKKSGMPKALGLQKNPSTKGLRKRLKRASWNARHQGDMRAKSTANAMKRALKWGIVNPGDWAFNKIVQWAADSLGEDLQTHEQLLERASARDLLEAVQGALQALPRTHEELYALARPREADALGRPAPVVQPEAPGREEGAPPPPSARNHDELYALALDAQARGYLEQVRAVQ